jgi:hypothetical protein
MSSLLWSENKEFPCESSAEWERDWVPENEAIVFELRNFLLASHHDMRILELVFPKYTLYRTMRANADGRPTVGRSFLCLGVRILGPSADVRVLDDGTVLPLSGGMSAFLDPRKMPKSLRPRTLAEKPGESPHPLFKLTDDKIPPTLAFRRDSEHHGLVEPSAPCKIEEYEGDLESTRAEWRT